MTAREFFSAAEILALGSPALPADKGGFSRLVAERGWRDDVGRARLLPGTGREGGTWEYHISVLPSEARAKLLAASVSTAAPSSDPSGATFSREGRRDSHAAAIWARFDALPAKAKAEATRRLGVVERVDALAAGMARQAAVALAAREAGISASTLWGWLREAGDVAVADRLPALAPKHKGRTATADCDPRAWDYLVADYLRPEQPSFDACHRRLMLAAGAQGWSPVPSAKTLRRRLDAQVPRAAAVLARRGRTAAQALYPHQTRDKGALHALEAVNADGHRFDVFVRWEDGAIGRPVMTAFQDVYSGMILAHRLDRSENWTAVRLCIADVVERFGIPEHAIFDNGRHFASKWLTGGTKTRFRFKVRDEDPRGILPLLGVEVHFATPYHGQAKPIERAFRDLCEDIAKHPACAGAYTGNKPDAKPENYGSKAIPIDLFRTLVAAELARHNQRDGRRSRIAAGRSLETTFRASFEASMIRRAGPEQRRMLLLAAEGVRASKRNGEIMLGDNRYWAEPLTELMGRDVVVRFDPQDLSLPIAVYRMDGRFVCEAACIEMSGFLDMDAARAHGRDRKAWLKAQRDCLDLERRMPIGGHAGLLPLPEPEAPARPSVIRLFADGSVASPLGPRVEPEDDSDAGDPGAASFARGLQRVFGDGASADILSFPHPQQEKGGRG